MAVLHVKCVCQNLLDFCQFVNSIILVKLNYFSPLTITVLDFSNATQYKLSTEAAG